MPSTTLPAITESQLLTDFLLAPSLLPTILPYTTFLTLIPQRYRSNPDYTPSLKRLYRDLQFQRSITVDQVRANIERECGERAATLRARLARQIAIEEGDVKAEKEEMKVVMQSRKRKRAIAFGARPRDGDDGVNSEHGIKEEETSEAEYDEFTDPRELEAQRTFHNHMSMFHPAMHVLPSDYSSGRRNLDASTAFHTQTSLIEAMENASSSLDREVEQLEAECAKLKEGMKETVDGLSDLRYGKSRPSKDIESNAGVDDGGVYKEVVSALEEFGTLLRTKTRSTAAVTS